MGFNEDRAAVEAEGVYIGGWSLKRAFIPKKRGGEMLTSKFVIVGDHTNYTTGEAKTEQVNALIDWEPAEERRLIRKLDLRVMLPCCIVYFLAYLDRANMVRFRT